MSSEEDRARALLLDRQHRIAESPYAALELPTTASTQDIRSAFLQLTKVFHPARFGRMSNEIQRLSNEVFLSLKAAHESLAKPKSSRSTTTTTIPVVRPSTRPFGVPLPPRPGVPQNPAYPEKPTTKMPVLPRAAGSGPTSTPMPTGTRPPPTTTARPTQSSPPVRPSAPPPANVKPSPTTPQPTQGRTPSAAMPALDPVLAPILEMIAAEKWDQAQRGIDGLAASKPQSKRYQALAMYCRGRRAQLERRLDDARVELQSALMTDPDLDLAKTALAELFARRK